jgi:hypothetical protein
MSKINIHIFIEEHILKQEDDVDEMPGDQGECYTLMKSVWKTAAYVCREAMRTRDQQKCLLLFSTPSKSNNKKTIQLRTRPSAFDSSLYHVLY